MKQDYLFLMQSSKIGSLVVILATENQLAVWWLGGQWYPQPIRVQALGLTLWCLIKYEIFSVEGDVLVDSETPVV
jgi:hypothetical protein